MQALWLEEGEGEKVLTVCPVCVGQEPGACLLPEVTSDNPEVERASLESILVSKEAKCWGTDTALGLIRNGHQPWDSHKAAGQS